MADNREKIQEEVGTKSVPAVGKKAGEMWAALDATAKAVYEKKAQEQKAAYEKYIATDAGKKALEEMKAAKNEAKAEKKEKKASKDERKNDRACKAELKAIAKDKDENLKKPQSAYWLWLGDNRSKIADEIGGGSVAAVAKKGGEMWKELSAEAKAPYEKKAKEQKDAYEKFITSEEGAAALKAFKDKTKAAKDQFKRKAEDMDGDEAGETPKKVARKKDTPTKVAKTGGATGRGRGKPKSEPSVSLPDDLMAKADKAGWASNLVKLAAREDVLASGKTHAEIFKALEESQGLLHPARRALLGA